eukprot:4154714-Lingulodinium_polyedra.AAC.1
MKCVSKRISEQLWRESYKEMRSDTHSAAAAPRILRRAHSMRRPPHGGGRRTKRVSRDARF